MHQTLIICSALLGLLVFGLGFNVSLVRNKFKDGASMGEGPSHPITKAVRAHANAAEYVGAIIALYVVTALVYAGRDLGIVATAIVVILTFSRFLHAAGMLTASTLATGNPMRFFGALFTYLGGLALSGLLLAKALI